MPRANASAARTWTFRQAQNAGRGCLVPGCHRERRPSSVDPCCATHARRRGLLGDPRLRALSRVDMRPWLERARAFVAENRDHVGIQRGIEILDALLARYVDLANGDRYRRFNVARRRQTSAIAEAAMQGMTGEDLLCALIASVHAGYDGPGDPTVEYGIREHHRLNDPRRREEVQAIVWTQAVGVRVKELRAADRRALGRELVSNVGPLLVRVADAIRRRQLREAHDRRVFAEPFGEEK